MSTVQVKVNDELRASAEAILHSIGLTMSEGVRLFLKQLVNHDGLPFRLQRSYELKDEIKEQIESIENGTANLIEVRDVDELMKMLNTGE